MQFSHLIRFIGVLFILVLGLALSKPVAAANNLPWWPVQSIDTMKYSRDIAREKLKDSSYDAVIERQVAQIAETGATHIAIATPYESEFVPFLKRWVDTARKHNLKVWFRGNLAGWENWFGYPRINRGQHIQKIKDYILANPDLFEDGDIFSSCPECENGGPGDPRRSGDAKGHRAFLIEEYQMVKQVFKDLDKEVTANYYSMNGDVANLIMDPETTTALDGIMAIDHYVGSPDKLVADIYQFAERSGGQVVLSEFGAPIPDIHGAMTEDQQAAWLAEALTKLSAVESLVGVNYWVNVGGSTQIWESNGHTRMAVATLSEFYKPFILKGVVHDPWGDPVPSARVQAAVQSTFTSETGSFEIPYLASVPLDITVSVPQQPEITIPITDASDPQTIVLPESGQLSWFQRWYLGLKHWFKTLLT